MVGIYTAFKRFEKQGYKVRIDINLKILIFQNLKDSAQSWDSIQPKVLIQMQIFFLFFKKTGVFPSSAQEAWNGDW